MARRSDRQDGGPNSGRGSSALAVQRQPVPTDSWGESDRRDTADQSRPADEPANQFDALNLVWVQLRGNWTWLSVLPAEFADSTRAISQALADVGSRLSAGPIDFMVAADMDLDRTSWLIRHLRSTAAEAGTQSGQLFAPGSWTRVVPRTIVALESPVANPLALPVALAADGVILCVRKGLTQLEAIRKTVEAVGAEKILCCIVLE